MEKNKIRNLNIKTKLKALLLSGVTLLTGISCGKSDVKAPEKDNSIAIEAETNTKTTKNTIESTVDNMIAEKETQENNTNDYVENYNYENEENNYVEDETNIETTETKTEEKTENKIEAPSKVYEEEIVMPKKGASMTPSTNHTTTKIKNSDIKITTTRAHTQHPTTTKKVTTQRHTTVKITTTKPVTTTVRVTEPPVTQPPTIPYERREYNKYDLMSDDPNVALFAHKNLTNQLGKELFNGYLHETEYGVSMGYEEAGALIVALNYNQPLNIEALGNIYNYESKEDFIKLTDNMNLASYQCMYNSRVDFTKYVIDEDFANYLNMVSEQCFNYENGDIDPLLNEIDNYFKYNSDGIDNYAKYYFMCNEKSIADYCTPEEMEEARRMFVDNVSSYIYDKFEPHKSKTLAR